MEHQHPSSIATDPEFDGSKREKMEKHKEIDVNSSFAHLQKNIKQQQKLNIMLRIQ